MIHAPAKFGLAPLVLLAASLLATHAATAEADPVDGRSATSERVGARRTDVYRLACFGGEATRIRVIGDGTTDLDLYVYDDRGNLVASDLGPTDRCAVVFTPFRTSVFRIEVRNRGALWNDYLIVCD